MGFSKRGGRKEYVKFLDGKLSEGGGNFFRGYISQVATKNNVHLGCWYQNTFLKTIILLNK